MVFRIWEKPIRSMKTKQQKPHDLRILEASQIGDELCIVQVTLLVMNRESLGFPDFWMPLPTPTWQLCAQSIAFQQIWAYSPHTEQAAGLVVIVIGCINVHETSMHSRNQCLFCNRVVVLPSTLESETFSLSLQTHGNWWLCITPQN